MASSHESGGPEGKSSILTTTNLDTPGFRWVGLKKLIWQVISCSALMYILVYAHTFVYTPYTAVQQ